jgi:hypothetical protein
LVMWPWESHITLLSLKYIKVLGLIRESFWHSEEGMVQRPRTPASAPC